jgi:hypothetical protein
MAGRDKWAIDQLGTLQRRSRYTAYSQPPKRALGGFAALDKRFAQIAKRV